MDSLSAAELSDQPGPLELTPPAESAAGRTAVWKSLKLTFQQAGWRGLKALGQLNQIGGIDCTSCAWPEPDDHRSAAEFCENGAKALAWELDQRRLTPEVFAQQSIEALGRLSDYEHGQLGRLTEPMIRRPGATHYERISWEDAFALVARELQACEDPDQAIFYTSGRTSNEAAYLYQLFVRRFGTNNLPDCSNMCHESSSVALPQAIGIGKGTVKLADFELADCIVLLGQNPGTNHPRMLTSLQKAKRNGAQIIAINPLREAGLIAFENPQEVRGMLGQGTPLADCYLQVKIGGDLALLKAVNRRLVARGAIDREFISQHTRGFESACAAWSELDERELCAESGITADELEEFTARLARSKKIIFCWAMGLTQQPHAVATIRELANLAFLRGSVGKPGAGLCPVRGHSNVQGDRTMGINEHPPLWFLEALAREYGFTPPSRSGYAVVSAVEAMAAGRARVFFAMGGNFLSAMSDTRAVAEALQKTKLTVHVAIKLNRSHLITGHTGLILPCLGRSEVDFQPSGPQFVTTENSMGVVERSQGHASPASPHLLSETRIISRLALALWGEDPRIPWADLADDYDRIREHIARVIPGFERMNQRVREPGGFYLPNGPREGRFTTTSGQAEFAVTPLTTWSLEWPQLRMMTIRSHDQFNTTVYGLDDRYRGIYGDRRVILMNADDLARLGLQPRDWVHITSYFEGETRTVRNFRVVPYAIPSGCCATYFPEANPIVPLKSTAKDSHTPTSKFVVVTVERSRAAD